MESLDRYAESELPTRFGSFRIVVYHVGDAAPDDERPEEHVAIVKGDVAGAPNVLVRVHSECMTGEVLGSLKCDCGEQLDKALEVIAAAGQGIVVYMRQEGRGIGLGNKIRAYALQSLGHDTVEANEALGFGADMRSYEQAAAILGDLEVGSVALMTNNPHKVAGLERAGVTVARRVAHWTTPGEHNTSYLQVKRAKLGHLDD